LVHVVFHLFQPQWWEGQNLIWGKDFSISNHHVCFRTQWWESCYYKKVGRGNEGVMVIMVRLKIMLTRSAIKRSSFTSNAMQVINNFMNGFQLIGPTHR
jgi:hypothetical protein